MFQKEKRGIMQEMVPELKDVVFLMDRPLSTQNAFLSREGGIRSCRKGQECRVALGSPKGA